MLNYFPYGDFYKSSKNNKEDSFAFCIKSFDKALGNSFKKRFTLHVSTKPSKKKGEKKVIVTKTYNGFSFDHNPIIYRGDQILEELFPKAKSEENCTVYVRTT